MQWCVVKIGAEMFDMLHASGLALLLAYATREPIDLVDQGSAYLLSSPATRVPSASPDILDEVLILPKNDSEMYVVEAQRAGEQTASDLALANLDGLLTTLFTTPGPRSLSVADVQQKAQRDPGARAQAIGKVAHAVALWKQSTVGALQQEKQRADCWLECLLRDYDLAAPAIPFPIDARKGRDLSLVMMLDPTFSYSSHRPRSNGLVALKTNLTIGGTPFAVQLALIGAARLLRAQRLAHGMVNCYVPLVASYQICAGTALPRLSFRASSPEQALVLQWLSYARVHHLQKQASVVWKGLAYQTIQTQGAQQSLSCQRGCLDLCWPLRLPQTERGTLLSLWRKMLWLPSADCPDAFDPLLDVLANRQLNAWIAHLLEVARLAYANAAALPRPYRWKEVQAMTDLMHPTSTPVLFQTILKRKTVGTLRVGRALRLLGRANRSGLNDLVEELERVQTLNQLTHALALTIQACVHLEAKTPFAIVPTEEDMTYLFEDVKQSDPHTIASFLILLSVLEYPGEGRKPAPQQPLHVSTCTF